MLCKSPNKSIIFYNLINFFIIKVNECKLKVDGISKFVQSHPFTFDNTFSEKETTQDVYKYTIKPLIDLLLKTGVVTCFAYGQTGSGKTFTMVYINYYLYNNCKWLLYLYKLLYF